MRWCSMLRSRLGELLDQHLRIASALVVLRPALGRQIIRRAFSESTLGLKIGESLCRQSNQVGQSHFECLVLHKLNQLFADALVLVRWADIKRSQLAFGRVQLMQ